MSEAKYEIIDKSLLEDLKHAEEPLEEAKKIGLYVEGWGILDYCKWAIEHNGYEMILIWGNQGSSKSSFMLYLAYQLLGDWMEVLKHLCFTPMDVIEKAEALPEGKRYTLLLWDDVGVHFPATSFRTNIDIYEEVGKMLDAYRTIASVIIATAPKLQRFPKCMRDNKTIEVWIARFISKPTASYYKALREIDLPNYYDGNSIYVKRPTIENGIYDYTIQGAPPQIWQQYWKRRLELGRKAVQMAKTTIGAPTKEEQKETTQNSNGETITLIKCPNGHVWVPRKRYVFGERVVCNKCGKVFPFKEENIIKMSV